MTDLYGQRDQDYAANGGPLMQRFPAPAYTGVRGGGMVSPSAVLGRMAKERALLSRSSPALNANWSHGGQTGGQAGGQAGGQTGGQTGSGRAAGSFGGGGYGAGVAGYAGGYGGRQEQPDNIAAASMFEQESYDARYEVPQAYATPMTYADPYPETNYPLM